jgi:hypothetical protein
MKKTSLNQCFDEQSPQSPAREEEVDPAQASPRGRPWAKGQSGNPRGRPTRARRAAMVVEGLIQRNAVPLTNKAVDLALAGDRAILRDCLDRLSPRRREPPADLELPKIKTRADLFEALTVIANATASGALTASQGATLTQMLIALRQSTW